MGKARQWWKAHKLFADQRCSWAVLDFLASMEVGKTVPAVEEDTRSEVSEWELQERAEQEEERSAESEALGMEVEAPLLFLPTPTFIASAEAESGTVTDFLCLSYVFFFLLQGIRLGGGQRDACTAPSERGLRRGNGSCNLVMI